MGDLLTNALPPVTREQKRRCAERELEMRRKVYPRWVEAGRLKQEKADEEIRIMAAIAEDYRDGS